MLWEGSVSEPCGAATGASATRRGGRSSCGTRGSAGRGQTIFRGREGSGQARGQAGRAQTDRQPPQPVAPRAARSGRDAPGRRQPRWAPSQASPGGDSGTAATGGGFPPRARARSRRAAAYDGGSERETAPPPRRPCPAPLEAARQLPSRRLGAPCCLGQPRRLLPAGARGPRRELPVPPRHSQSPAPAAPRPQLPATCGVRAADTRNLRGGLRKGGKSFPAKVQPDLNLEDPRQRLPFTALPPLPRLGLSGAAAGATAKEMSSQLVPSPQTRGSTWQGLP